MHTVASVVSSRWRLGLAFVAVFACLTAVAAGQAWAQGGGAGGDAAFLAEEGVPPPGANDPTCEPSAEHPQPVVLVHGTFEDMAQNWATLSPALRAQGYCVYALNYGDRATGPIQDSAAELEEFVGNVRELTGARKVDMVGHSQGGMMPRYYIKNLGGVSEVDDLVGLAPSNHGTTIADENDPLCAACAQQAAGSEFLQRLNRGNETPGPISYTQIATRYDEVVIPYTSAFLDGAPARLNSNITLQDYNPANAALHNTIYNDPDALTLVFDALEHPGPADPERARTP